MTTPLKSIRKYCVNDCMAGSASEVKLCPSNECIFYKFRLGSGRPKLKEIKEFCLGCGEGTAQAIRNCEFPECPLFQYRLGHNPKLKGRKGNVENLRPFMKNKQ